MSFRRKEKRTKKKIIREARGGKRKEMMEKDNLRDKYT